MVIAAWILMALSAVALVLFGAAIVATRRHVRAPVPELDSSVPLPPVSILKPLKGTEDSLEANLRSFFEQDYDAPFEIVFSSTEPDDPALDVARRVARAYPEVPARFVASDPDFGLNPKVANLRGALRGARYELVLQSDANVRAQPDYLSRVVRELLASDGALLSSLVVGEGERSLGAILDNVQLSAFTAPGCAFALQTIGLAVVIGKSMLFRKRDLEEVGGLELVRDVLAEDYVLGRAFAQAGKRVVLSSTPAINVNCDTTVEHFVARHARWLKMRATIHVPGFVGDLLSNPPALALLAVCASGFDPRFIAMFVGLTVVKAFGDNYLIALTRGQPLRRSHRWLTPLRDLLMLGVWPYAAISRSVEWRGRRLRLGWGTRLRPDDGPLPVRVARRILALRLAP
ncbi:MAG: glycosyltransferase [Sandaracinaceae bacterium]